MLSVPVGSSFSITLYFLFAGWIFFPCTRQSPGRLIASPDFTLPQRNQVFAAIARLLLPPLLVARRTISRLRFRCPPLAKPLLSYNDINVKYYFYSIFDFFKKVHISSEFLHTQISFHVACISLSLPVHEFPDNAQELGNDRGINFLGFREESGFEVAMDSYR